jgi:hypothetical protein
MKRKRTKLAKHHNRLAAFTINKGLSWDCHPFDSTVNAQAACVSEAEIVGFLNSPMTRDEADKLTRSIPSH